MDNIKNNSLWQELIIHSLMKQEGCLFHMPMAYAVTEDHLFREHVFLLRLVILGT